MNVRMLGVDPFEVVSRYLTSHDRLNVDENEQERETTTPAKDPVRCGEEWLLQGVVRLCEVPRRLIAVHFPTAEVRSIIKHA